jgi:hypothetical protein
MLNNVEQCSHRIYYDDDIIYSANEYYIRTLIVLAVLVLTALSTVVQTVRADDAHANPPAIHGDSPGYQNGLSGTQLSPCNNAPPSNNDVIQPGNSEQNPILSHCD